MICIDIKRLPESGSVGLLIDRSRRALEAELAEAVALNDAGEVEVALGANEIVDGDRHVVGGSSREVARRSQYEGNSRVGEPARHVHSPPVYFQRATGRACCARLFHRDREPAEIGVRHQPDLPARELENGALLVGEHDRPDAGTHREAYAGRSINAGNVGGALDVFHPPAKDSLRAAEHEAVVEAADPERIAAAAEIERAAAA